MACLAFLSLSDMMLSCFVVWLGKGQRQPENAFLLWITLVCGMGFNLVSGCLVGKSIRAARAVFVELRLPIGKPPRVNCIAHFLHNHLIKMQIVYGVELCAQNLAHFVR